MSPKAEEEREDLSEKCAELEAALEEANERAEKYLGQLKYARADLENLQKRTQRRIEEAIERANGRLIEQLLPVLDELGLAIEAAGDSDEGIVAGVRMVKGRLEKVLGSEGVRPIEAVGRQFDPHYHEAVLEVETQDHPDGCVLEEIRKGYTYKDRVIRASMVKVARHPSSEEVKEENESG